MVKDTRLRWLIVAAFAAVCITLPWSASGGAFPANNAGIAFVRGGQVFTSPSSSASGATNIAAGANPAVSANGQTVAYDNGAQIFTIPFAGGASTPLVGAVGTQPAWSFGGATIVFSLTAGSDIATVPYPAGGAPTNLTNTPAVTEKDPSVSPDGTKIAYSSNATGTFQIYVMNADGSGKTQLTSTSSNDTEPSWSPSGASIAFVSDRLGSKQIFTMSSSGGGATQITSDAAQDTSPAWSPDGTLILYSSSTAGLQTIQSSGGTVTTLPGTLAGDIAPDWQDGPPVNTAAPTISPSGPFAQGTTLFASTGSWTGSPTSFTYKWQRCDTSSSSCAPSDAASAPQWTTVATSSSYTTQAADIGATKKLRVVVTATNIAGSTDASSAFAGQANGLAPVNIAKPTIAGTYTADFGFVSASPGTWTGKSPITYTYQWLHCFGHTTGECVPIPGATSSFYSPNGDDIDTQLNVAVIATNSAGVGGASSDATPYITGTPPKNHVSPTISGGIEVGSVLTTTDGVWYGSQPITFTYQWRICRPDGSDCNSIIGATGKTYTLRPEDYGSTIRMMIRGRNGAGFGYGISNHTFPVQHKTLFGPASSQAPTVAGPTRAGEVLTASPGTWTGEAPIAFGYAWQRCDATGAGCKRIRGGTKPTYRLARADVGSTIRVAVTATNIVNKATVSSDPTDAISAQRVHHKGRKIVGKPGQTVLVGTPNDDVIFAGPGNVTIYGMGGFDQIHAGSGNDVIYLGTGGSSHVWGGPGSNTIYAANGERDTIDCGKGPSRVYVDAFDVVRHCTVVTTAPPGGANAPVAVKP